MLNQHIIRIHPNPRFVGATYQVARKRLSKQSRLVTQGRTNDQLQRIRDASGQLVAFVGRQVAFDQRGEFQWRERRGRHGGRGHGQYRRARSRAWLEGVAIGAHRLRRDFHRRRYRRTGRDPANLDDADRQLALLHPAHLLGRERPAGGRMPGGRFLWRWLGRIRAVDLAADLRQPGQRFQLLLGDALPPALPHHHEQYRRRRDDALLPGQLHADRCARRRRLFPRPIPPNESLTLQRCLHHR